MMRRAIVLSLGFLLLTGCGMDDRETRVRCGDQYFTVVVDGKLVDVHCE